MLEQYKVHIDEEEQAKIINSVNKENLYADFISSQEQGFIRFMNYIYTVVDELKRKAKVSQFIEIRARIKDVVSALANFDKNKLLDDVFGIEIICATENDIHTIKNELEKYLHSTRTKFHDKTNGYKAWHECYSAKESAKEQLKKWDLYGECVPAVECQFKTMTVELNPEASHHDYKNVDKAQMQSKLGNETLKVGIQIPRMWVSRENGFHELQYKEIIQRVYPFIDITAIKEPEQINL